MQILFAGAIAKERFPLETQLTQLGITCHCHTLSSRQELTPSWPLSSNYDLLISDHQLADGNSGLQLFEQLRQQNPNLLAIIVSDQHSDEIARDVNKHHTFNYLSRQPNTLRYLPATIKLIADQQRKMRLRHRPVANHEASRLDLLQMIDQAIAETYHTEELLQQLVETIRMVFHSDRAYFAYPVDPEIDYNIIPAEAHLPQYPGAHTLGEVLELAPGASELFQRLLNQSQPIAEEPRLEEVIIESKTQVATRANLVVAIKPRIGQAWTLGLHQCSYPRHWSEDEKQRLEEVAERLRDLFGELHLQRQLQRSEERLALAMQASGGGVYEQQLTANQESYVDPRWLEIIGYQSDEIPHGANFQRWWFHLVHPEDRHKVIATYRAINQGQTQYQLELRMRHKSGRWIEVQSFGQALDRDPQGRPTRVVGVAIDITKNKLAEEALYAEKERAQVTLHCIADAVITTDAVGNIEYMNPRAEQLIGYQQEELIGYSIDHNLLLQTISEPPQRIAIFKYQVPELPTTNRIHSQEALLSNRLGEQIAVHLSSAPITDHEGKLLGSVVAISDISQIHQLSQKMAHQAHHDPLTGLINRRKFETRLKHAIQSAQQNGNRHVLCYLDLDHFKQVNDQAGHEAGDQLLRQVSQLFIDTIRHRDTFARIGGDEFALILENCQLEKGVELANLMINKLTAYRFQWQERTFQVGVSIGITPISGEESDSATLLRQADAACYQAKTQGKNCSQLFDSFPPQSTAV